VEKSFGNIEFMIIFLTPKSPRGDFPPHLSPPWACTELAEGGVGGINGRVKNRFI